jgi:predicted type IV restriction endonuclease
MKTAADYPKLNLPPCRLRVSRRGGELCVWDSGRGRWLILTGEEWVRRHVLSMLVSAAGVAPANIAQEYPVVVNGQSQRADIVVFGPRGPLMLVECKASEVPITGAVLDQAFRYNAVLGARYVMLTGGLDHYIYEVSPEGDYTPLKDFPPLTRS